MPRRCLCVISALLFGAIAIGQGPAWKDKPVLDTSKSSFAVLHGVPASAVIVRDGFWAPRRKAAIANSLPTFLELLEQNGEIDNFRRLSGRKNVARRGRIPTDADVYKWLEAVAFAVQSGDVTPPVRKAAEDIIDDISAGQDSSGYMVSAFMGENAAQRHTAMARNHELYIFGHMLQAAVAWYRATGDRKLLTVGTRMADYLLANFGPGKKPIFEGHPEVELALVELYRTVGNPKYLELAGYFLNGDPRNMAAVRPADLVYLFTVSPFIERTHLEGHAVRAMYALSGATDYYLETGDKKYWATLTTLWDDMTHRKMYITGGLGSRSQGEAFGDPYELPNRTAYAESCAAIGNVFWNWRMLQATADAKYTDTLERALYNGANSGLSLDGKLYCYRNPLEVGDDPETKTRNPWYSTPCCPPNLERLLASLPGYFYSTSKDGVWVHLFDNAEMKWKLEDGTPIGMTQRTRYPWDGAVTITVSPSAAKEFTVFVRKPSWSDATRLEVAGATIGQPAMKNGYFAIRRTWKPGDQITVSFDMKAHVTTANPLVSADIGKVAVERGPLVYAAESLDQPTGTTVFDWQLASGASFQEQWKPELLGGILTLTHPAMRPAAPNREQPLYQPRTPGKYTAGTITLIPYYTYQNREPTSMEVWLPLHVQ